MVGSNRRSILSFVLPLTIRAFLLPALEAVQPGGVLPLALDKEGTASGTIGATSSPIMDIASVGVIETIS